jgi:hypothetical protein
MKYLKVFWLSCIGLYVVISLISAPMLSAAYMQELCVKDSSHLPRYDIGNAGAVGLISSLFWPIWADKLYYELIGKYSLGD